jgi:glycosyltransferase involved in cell wall biosynthesis
MQLMIEITIPILNEEATLNAQVRKTRAFIDHKLSDLAPITLVLADNGSTDATSDIARKLESDLEGIRYLRLEERGVGRALKSSWGQSSAQIVGYMDLDLATNLRYLRPALEMLRADQADIVTGSRLAKGSQVIGRSLFNLLLRIVFRISFSDGMCGFKFLKRSSLDELRAAGAVSDGWFFATEILITAEYLGLRVGDLPVEWTDDPNSKVKIGKLVVEYLKAIKVLRRHLPKRAISA